MIDYLNLGKYTENNRIEAKKATGGLPESIWETYSAFANTLGGVILLGVIENKDKSLAAINLENPEKLADEFLKKVNDKSVVSANVLKRGAVKIKKVDNKNIVVITVPRAQGAYLPVYVGENVFDGCYFRSGEGDYKLEKGQVESLIFNALSAKDNGDLTDEKGEALAAENAVKRLIVEFLTKNAKADLEEITENLSLSIQKIRKPLAQLLRAQVVVRKKVDDNFFYELKR